MIAIGIVGAGVIGGCAEMIAGCAMVGIDDVLVVSVPVWRYEPYDTLVLLQRISNVQLHDWFLTWVVGDHH